MPEQNRYIINTVAAAPREGLNINHGSPLVLIGDAQESRNVLGSLPIDEAEEPNWVCILPLQQPQGDCEDGICAGMNAPMTEKWCTIDELNHDLLAPNIRFMLQHLEEPGAAVGFNYSPDPRTRVVSGAEQTKFKPNSWDHFHMHWMTGVSDAAQEVGVNDTVTLRGSKWSREVRPHRYLREMLPHVIEGVLDQEYRRPDVDLGGVGRLTIDAESRKTLPYAPDGGIMFALPIKTYGSPQELSQAIKDVHEMFVATHNRVWGLFVSNYDEVQASQWTTDYIFRSKEEITEHLEQFTDDESLRVGMFRYFAALRPAEEIPNPMNWLYKGPSHSMAIYKHDSNYILSLLPHMMHPTNWLAAMGIFEVRQNQEVELEGYRAIASAHAGKLGAMAVPFVLPSLGRNDSV